MLDFSLSTPFYSSNYSALSPLQEEKAQEHCPELLQQSAEEINAILKTVFDREIQEKLKKEHNIVDNSKLGREAWNHNCEVIHHPSKYR